MECALGGEGMIDYLNLVLAALLLFSSVYNVIRWFIIEKDYGVSSFAAVIIQFVLFLHFLIRSI